MTARHATKHRRTAPNKPHEASRHPKSVPVLEPTDRTEVEQPFASGTDDTLDADLRHRLVSETAFHHLAERGYAEGYETEDWQDAAAEVDHVVIKPDAPDTR